MKSITFFLTLIMALSSWSESDYSSVEAKLVSIEFYEASGEYALVFRTCKRCRRETIRLSKEVTTTLNSHPSTIQNIYNNRHALRKGVSFYLSKKENRILRLHVARELTNEL